MTAFDISTRSDRDRDGAAPGRVAMPPLVASAVTVMDTNLREPFTVEDLADECGVSARALQYAFRRHLGITPMAYARQARLAEAHRELQEASPEQGATVAGIASAWGFLNPGRFAAYYAQQYGRRPSETLYDIRRA